MHNLIAMLSSFRLHTKSCLALVVASMTISLSSVALADDPHGTVPLSVQADDSPARSTEPEERNENGAIVADQESLPAEAYDRHGNLREKMKALDGYDDPPPPYASGTRPHRPLWIVGTATTAGTWAVTVVGSLLAYSYSNGWIFAKEHDDAFLYGTIPVVGPFVQVGIHINRDEFSADDGFALAMGGLQLGSLGMLIAGLSIKQDMWVLQPDSASAARVEFTVSPGLTGFRGSF
jgi:hypothetical protein